METSQLTRRRVLVVDDSVYMRKALEILLSTWGFEVTAVGDGQAAVGAARELRPVAVLLDIRLPELDGLAAARRIRADPDSAALLLIAMTGSNAVSDRTSSEAAGFDHHLVKPLNTGLLRELLERAVAAQDSAGRGGG